MQFERRKLFRAVIIGLYLLAVVIAVPIIIAELASNNTKTHVIAWVSGGVFTACTLPVSLWNILSHLLYYNNPFLQRYIIRILWMVPIYSINAWLAIRYPNAAIYLDTIRECYEAFVLYSFMAYLMKYLYSNYPDLNLHLEEKPSQRHLIPFCCLPRWRMGTQMIQRCRHGVLQYTVVRPLMTVFALIFEFAGLYREGVFGGTNSWTYIVVINNISQVWALYCLVLFYQVVKVELSPVRPIWKFGCVKAVIFMAFWQGVAIAIIVKFGWISSTQSALGYMSAEEVSKGLQDFLICIEMFFISIAFLYAFPYTPFQTPIHTGSGVRSGSSFPRAFFAMWDMRDVRADLADHIKTVGSGVSKIRPANPFSTPIETSRKHASLSEAQPLLVTKSTSEVTGVAQYFELADMQRIEEEVLAEPDVSRRAEPDDVTRSVSDPSFAPNPHTAPRLTADMDKLLVDVARSPRSQRNQHHGSADRPSGSNYATNRDTRSASHESDSFVNSMPPAPSNLVGATDLLSFSPPTSRQ